MKEYSGTPIKLLRLGLAASLTVALVLTLAPVPAAHAASMTVADGAVAIAADGQCALREAIQNANDDAATNADCPAGSGADTLELAAGSTYTLPDFADGTDGRNGLPFITTQITINGNGATIRRDPALTCTIDGTQTAAEFRIFLVGGTGNLSLNGVTVSNGCADGNPSSDPAAHGGGLYVRSGGTVTITNSTFSNNTARYFGGGLNNGGGTLTISDSTISNNTAVTTGSSGGGGGLYNSGTTTITGSTFSGNSAASGYGGGGVLTRDGTVDVSGSSFSGNTAYVGGGIASGLDFGTPELSVTNSTFSSNSAQADGGGISSNGVLTIVGSTFSGNSTLGEGGGLSHINETATITNSTFSGNSAGTDGGGVWYRDDDDLQMSNVTIASNTATGDGGGFFTEDAGDSAANVANTIIAGNSDVGNNAPDCGGEALFSLGYNLVQNTTGCSFTLATGDKTGQNPNLGALANNGGSTQTHALLSGSPAIDAGNSATCASKDQRDVARPIDGDSNGTAVCDIGAYEAPASAPSNPAPAPWATPAGGRAIGSAGGEFDCGEWVFTFAAGSVPDGSTLHCGAYDPNFAPGAPSGFTLLRKTVNVHVYDRNGNRQVAFSPPFTACYARSGYRDADVLAAGGSTGNFAVLTGEIGGAYTPLSTTVDTAVRRACGASDHLSLFELAARTPSALPATGAAIPPALGWGAGLLALAGAAGWAAWRRKTQGA